MHVDDESVGAKEHGQCLGSKTSVRLAQRGDIETGCVVAVVAADDVGVRDGEDVGVDLQAEFWREG